MCFGGRSKSQPAPQQEAPKRDDEEIQRRRQEEEEVNRRRLGRRANILTTGLGDAGFGTNTRRARLLGEVST